MATTDRTWDAQDTHPDKVEAAIRRLVVEAHAEDESYVPARVLNLVVIVDHDYAGEVANRLRGVGRYHPSRTVVCSVDRHRTTIDARASVAAPSETASGMYALARETVALELGTKHVRNLLGIVDPLVVTDLPTVVWAPHGHEDAVDRVLPLSQVVLQDSDDESEPADAMRRAMRRQAEAYVVDLSWLRTTPWRERLAFGFDPPQRRAELATIARLRIRHHPSSEMPALLLIGWLASRLGWKLSPLTRTGAALTGRAGTRRQEISLRLEVAPEMRVRGLQGMEVELASGRNVRFDRGEGGLHATVRDDGDERSWVITGASRGESGILGEGIRQALLRDPTHLPALQAAAKLVGL